MTLEELLSIIGQKYDLLLDKFKGKAITFSDLDERGNAFITIDSVDIFEIKGEATLFFHDGVLDNIVVSPEWNRYNLIKPDGERMHIDEAVSMVYKMCHACLDDKFGPFNEFPEIYAVENGYIAILAVTPGRDNISLTLKKDASVILCDIPEGSIEKRGDALYLLSEGTEWKLSGHRYEPCIFVDNKNKALSFTIHNATDWFPALDAGTSEWERFCKYITRYMMRQWLYSYSMTDKEQKIAESEAAHLNATSKENFPFYCAGNPFYQTSHGETKAKGECGEIYIVIHRDKEYQITVMDGGTYAIERYYWR